MAFWRQNCHNCGGKDVYDPTKMVDHNKKERSVIFSQPFRHARVIRISQASCWAMSHCHVTETKFEHVVNLLEARYQAFWASHQKKICCCWWNGNWKHCVENPWSLQLQDRSVAFRVQFKRFSSHWIYVVSRWNVIRWSKRFRFLWWRLTDKVLWPSKR